MTFTPEAIAREIAACDRAAELSTTAAAESKAAAENETDELLHAQDLARHQHHTEQASYFTATAQALREGVHPTELGYAEA